MTNFAERLSDYFVQTKRNKRMKVSLVISTYNWPEALELCLMSALNQTRMPDEIVIADDGSRDDTRQLVASYKNRFKVPVLHIWHEDLGFRLAMIRNRALRAVTGDYVIQVDGDVILDSHFVADHIDVAERGCFIRGTRCCITEEVSKQLLQEKRASLKIYSKGLKSRFNATRLPLAFSRKKREATKVKGCNMAFWKEDLVKVNGYNNQLQGWGHEDEELCCRLINLGLQKKIVKMHAVVYHLHHKLSSRDSEDEHKEVLQRCIRERVTRAEDGYEQIIVE